MGLMMLLEDHIVDCKTLSGATLSKCNKYRYSLWRTWNKNKTWLLFIMLNPSIADAMQDDPTIRRCIAFAKAWGHGGLLVGNLFAYRATNPFDLLNANKNKIIGSDNDEYLIQLIAQAKTTVVAWGNYGSLLNRSTIISNRIHYPMCLGVNKTGEPKHPLYMSAKTKLQNYYIKE